MTKRTFNMKGVRGKPHVVNLSICDSLIQAKVLPLWRAPLIRGNLERVLRRERRDYVEGHAGRATRDPIRQAIKIRVMLPYICVALYEGTRVTKNRGQHPPYG